MSPPTLTSYSFTGTFFPEPCKALLTAHFKPVQQGTSMWTTVIPVMLFSLRISVSLAAYAWASLNLGHPMTTRLPAIRSWKFLRTIGAQSAVRSRFAFSKKGAFGGTRSYLTGH